MANLITRGLGSYLDTLSDDARVTFFSMLVAECESAMLALVVENKRSYTFNTGQSSQSVSRRDLNEIKDVMSWALGMLELYQSRVSGGSVVIMRPAF